MSTNIQQLAHNLIHECGVPGALLALRHDCQQRAAKCRAPDQRSAWEKREAILEQAQEMAHNCNGRLLFPFEAAARLRLDEMQADPVRTVKEMVKRRELEGRLVGRRMMIVAESVDRFIREGDGASPKRARTG